MNKRGEEGAEDDNQFRISLAYIIMFVLFLIVLFMFINNQRNGAAVWEQYYSSEVVKVINLANPGDEVILDVQKATEVAQKNGVYDLTDIIRINSDRREVCVKLNDDGRSSCLNYYNTVRIVYVNVVLDPSGNKLKFKVEEE